MSGKIDGLHLFSGRLRGVQPDGLKSCHCCDDNDMRVGGNYHP